MRNIVRFIKQEEGATAIEYGLIASLIAVAIVGVLVTLGPALSGVFSTVQAKLLVLTEFNKTPCPPLGLPLLFSG